MKPLIRLSFLSVFFTLFLFSANTQTFDYVKQADGTINFTIEQPPLKAKTKAVPVTPFYKHTILFGDGTFQFLQSGDKGQVDHLYGPSLSSFFLNYTPRAYSSGAYSEDDDDIPEEIAPPVVPPITGVYPAQHVVDSNRYIKVMRFVEVKPGDSFINVLSIRNPNTTTFTGQLFFFYNGRLNAVKKDKKEELSDFSEFNISDNLFYRPDVGTSVTLAYDTMPASIQTKYEKMLLMEINNLPPGDEIHYFMEMEGDTTMMDLFDATVKAEMDFGLALGSFNDNLLFLVPDSMQTELNTLKISSYAASLGGEFGVQADRATMFSQNGDSTVNLTQLPFLQSGASIIVDYYTSTASLVKSHDPNYMRMEACDCPGTADLYQVFTTIHCENNGYGETNHVYMDMKLPNGVSADDVTITPVSYYPYVGAADQISMEVIAEDSIRWRLENFGIEGTPIHGVGDPRTYAEVQFNMYSDIEPSLLDSVYACIRFDDLSSDPVCTIPVAVSLVGAELSEGILTCTQGDCSDRPTPPVSWPWWVWLLIVLLILLALWLFARNN